MNPLLPTILIVHAEEAIPLIMLEFATHHRIATVAINLRTLNQFQFFASQSGHGRNQFFLNNSAGQTLNLNYLHGLYAQSWHKIAQQFHQPSTSDSLYLTQAWIAFFMWLTQSIPQQIGTLKHHNPAARNGQLWRLKQHCYDQGLAMPSIRSWQSLSASEKQQPWIGRTSLNQHYDFRPKCGIKHPMVMAAPPKHSQMIWLHFLGRKCFVTHSSHERFSAPSEIQAQCYRIMKSMGSNVGQFLLCQTQKKWLCYDFNPLPNWQLCHKKYSFIAEQLVTILAPSYAFNSNKKTAFQEYAIPQTAAPTISNSTTQRPKKPPQPFIAKHLRPELAAAKYHIE